MPISGSSQFPPVLHNITPERVVFCYRLGDADSLEVAQYYANQRSVPSSNLIALPCSNENQITQSEYVSTIETPLITALTALGDEFTSGGQSEIWVIILGYNIPHIYALDADPYGEPLAIASRLHRLGNSIDLKRDNFTFDRRDLFFRFFDTDDAAELYITAVIDGPTKEVAMALIDRSIDVDNQTFVTGKMYIDPYGKKDTADQLEYEDDILDFVLNSSSGTGLDIALTVDNPVNPLADDPYFGGQIGNPYQDPLIDFLQNDSFYWGWFVPEFSHSLFLNQNERRVFLYNADDDGADDIAAPLDFQSSNPWVNLAINVEPGYAATAGAVSAPTEDSYLRPRPFFEALHRGATIGEAFLFSSKHVDWKMVLIGDPLMVVNFPVDLPAELDQNFSLLPNDEAILRIKEALEESIGYGARQSRLTQDQLNKNLASSNFAEELNLLFHLTNWHSQKDITTHQDILSNPVSAWLTYILQTNNQTLPQWLFARNQKISSDLNSVVESISSSSVDTEFIFPQGHWIFDFVYTHSINTFENIHFVLQVSETADFTELVVDVSTLNSVSGWKYESEQFIFVQLSESGFPSNFSGRRLRFDSTPEHRLRKTEEYFVRWRAFRANGSPLDDYVVASSPMLVSH